MEFFVQLILPIVAVIVSVWALINSWFANRIQNRVNKLEEKLKKYELEKVELERRNENKAKVEARAYKVTQGKYRIRFWNSGKGTAYDVNFYIPLKEADKLVIRSNVPYEFLESGKSFEERIVTYMGSPNKFVIITTWKDANGVDNSKKGIISF